MLNNCIDLEPIFTKVFKPKIEFNSYYFNVNFNTLNEALKILKILEHFGFEIASCQDDIKANPVDKIANLISKGKAYKHEYYISVNVTDMKQGDKDLILIYWFSDKADYESARRYSFREALIKFKEVKLMQKEAKRKLKIMEEECITYTFD